jgi:uncharacterized protein YdeI (YjbR/CyaY-like superfamily)
MIAGLAPAALPRVSMRIVSFTSSPDLRTWLAKNHSQSEGIWLRIYKKNSGVTTVTYAEALDQSLCFGWIDGQKKPHDDQSWLQKLTPRDRRALGLRRILSMPIV